MPLIITRLIGSGEGDDLCGGEFALNRLTGLLPCLKKALALLHVIFGGYGFPVLQFDQRWRRSVPTTTPSNWSAAWQSTTPTRSLLRFSPDPAPSVGATPAPRWCKPMGKGFVPRVVGSRGSPHRGPKSIPFFPYRDGSFLLRPLVGGNLPHPLIAGSSLRSPLAGFLRSSSMRCLSAFRGTGGQRQQ
jgi:hypothetical protein